MATESPARKVDARRQRRAANPGACRRFHGRGRAVSPSRRRRHRLRDLHARSGRASWRAGTPAPQRFKGYTAEEIIGQHFSRFYTDEDRRGRPARAARSQHRASDGKFEAEGWRVRKDGTRFWAHVVIDPIRDADGRADRLRQDHPRHHRAQGGRGGAARQPARSFRLLVQGVTDYAIYMLDPTGHVANWNAGAERIKGYAPDEIIGQHFSRFYTEEDRAAGEPATGLETAEREGRFEKEGWRVRKDGTRFWANVVIDPIRDDDGRAASASPRSPATSPSGATAQQKLEQAREALFQSQKMDAIGQLTGGVAHDFNNLLTAVLGSLELVQRRIGDDPRVAPLVANAMQAAQRGATLTQRMLAFARRQELGGRSTISAPGRRHGRPAGPLAGLEHHHRHALSADHRPVLVDRNQLEMAVLNLRSMRAMPCRAAARSPSRRANRSSRTPARPARGPLCRAVGHRSRRGHGRGDAAAGDRAVLHDQGRRQGHRPRPFDGPRPGRAVGRPLVLKSKPGEGTTASLWLPVIAGAAERRRRRPREAPSVAAASRSPSWRSTTMRWC